jgi:hypothetical protein
MKTDKRQELIVAIISGDINKIKSLKQDDSAYCTGIFIKAFRHLAQNGNPEYNRHKEMHKANGEPGWLPGMFTHVYESDLPEIIEGLQIAKTKGYEGVSKSALKKICAICKCMETEFSYTDNKLNIDLAAIQ